MPAAPPDLAPLPPPRPTLRGVAAAAGLWAAFALLYTVAIVQSGSGPFVGVLVGQLMMTVVLALLSVPAWWLVVRRMDRAPAWRKVAAHALLGPLYAWTATEVYLGLLRATAPPSVALEVTAAYAWLALAFFWIYGLQFALFHGVRSWQRHRASERQAAEWQALARERELASLRAQVQPHFLFNTLNSISATVARDPDASRAMLARLADLLRYALESGERPWVPLRRELDAARDYLALERHRMRERLRFELDADADALGARVPPMTLQPLVENAVKHGLAPTPEGGTVRLVVRRDGDRVRVTVEDDGCPAPMGDGPMGALAQAQTGSTGIGLANTSRRLTHLHGPHAALEAGPLPEGGWRVAFAVPLEEDPAPVPVVSPPAAHV